MQKFLTITGDVNPLHNDEMFAVEHGFEKPIVYGMLTASLISTLGGVYLPGELCLIQQIEVKFVAPVYIGDVLTVIGTIKEMSKSVRQAVIKVEIKNQKGKKVLKGNLYVGFVEETKRE